mmetsp:Transcript_51792/g.70635  ORF Transcript_51792/g.70635 Transcript_51792/m.70635 type:complete len:89 (+) Transcript_51792:1229-1495(+)
MFKSLGVPQTLQVFVMAAQNDGVHLANLQPLAAESKMLQKNDSCAKSKETGEEIWSQKRVSCQNLVFDPLRFTSKSSEPEIEQQTKVE